MNTDEGDGAVLIFVLLVGFVFGSFLSLAAIEIDTDVIYLDTLDEVCREIAGDNYHYSDKEILGSYKFYCDLNETKPIQDNIIRESKILIEIPTEELEEI